ncbi:MAG: hypothetical protein JJ863_11145 [Deltaproteobacteria bacterium]|nr:hypothetical protein [Deltaproteobacteria bacterium]
MRAVIFASVVLLLGCNEDAEEGPEACMRSSVGDACSFTDVCRVEAIDDVDGRCGYIAHGCRDGRVVEIDQTMACAVSPDLGRGDDGGLDFGPGPACDDGLRNGDESDVDCGGGCDSCQNGRSCADDTDCISMRCVDEACVSPEGTHPDVVRVDDVVGRDPASGWSDSYSVGAECYCESTFDHAIGDIEVETPFGSRTVRQVCDALGPGPGSEGRPVYNDIQCGNGPANDAGDEDDCPGRVDIGRDGCGHIGPRWHLETLDSI